MLRRRNREELEKASEIQRDAVTRISEERAKLRRRVQDLEKELDEKKVTLENATRSINKMSKEVEVRLFWARPWVRALKVCSLFVSECLSGPGGCLLDRWRGI